MAYTFVCDICGAVFSNVEPWGRARSAGKIDTLQKQLQAKSPGVPRQTTEGLNLVKNLEVLALGRVSTHRFKPASEICCVLQDSPSIPLDRARERQLPLTPRLIPFSLMTQSIRCKREAMLKVLHPSTLLLHSGKV